MKKPLLIGALLLSLTACSTDPEIPADQLTIVNDLLFEVQDESLMVSVLGDFRNGCEQVDQETHKTKGSTTTITITKKEEGEMCIQALMPYIQNVELNLSDLGTGEHTFIVNGTEKTFTLP